jgi:glycosyltransferase involved in cell wall biosynthesis
MFVGGFAHRPNLDAIIWFCQEVMPLLVDRDPRFWLSIAGSNPPAELNKLVTTNIRLLGRLSDEDLHVLYRGSGIAVVPLRYGAGVKGKVIQAMGLGVPLVMTDVGAQGIPGAESLAFVGNTPAELAECVFKAAYDREDALRRAKAGLVFIRSNYSLRAVTRLLSRHFPELDAAAVYPHNQ